MCVSVSFVMAILYGVYAVGYYGSSHQKYCLANQVDYYPYKYETLEEMNAFL